MTFSAPSVAVPFNNNYFSASSVATSDTAAFSTVFTGTDSEAAGYIRKGDSRGLARALRRDDTTRGNGVELLDYQEIDRVDDGFYRPDGASAAAGKRQRVASQKSRRDDDDADEDVPFLRSRRRVPVRRGWIPQSLLGRILFGAGAALLLGVTAYAAYAAEGFLRHDPRFRIATASSIRIVGNSEASRADLLGVFGEDIGRNIFFVPLADRRKQMETLPWIAHATVMRLLPDQLRVSVTERMPVAFVQHGSRSGLVDGEGVLLEMPPHPADKHYSFPVVSGINASDPLSTRAARMKIFARFVQDLDAGGEHVSSKLSEVDLSEPEDVRAVIADGDRSLLIHFGDENFLDRYHGYQAHIAEWRAQYPNLAAVDARYDTQFVLEMAKGNAAAPEKATVKTAQEENQNAPQAADAATGAPAEKPAAIAQAKPHVKRAHFKRRRTRAMTLQQLRQQRVAEQR